MGLKTIKVTDLPIAQDPAQFEIVGFDLTTNAGAKAGMADLKGDPGPTPNITITMTALPYGSTPTVSKTGTEAAPSFEIGFPLAQDGKTPMFQNDGTNIQYRYSDTDPWQNLVALDTLRLHYTDLTDAQKQELMQPALDAAEIANDAADAANEAAANVQDGKTPQMSGATAVSIAEDQQPTAQFVQTGTDASGNPQYRLDLGIPQGTQGLAPKLVGDQLQAAEPGSAPVLVLVLDGKDTTTGQDIYRLTGSIPKGDPGDGSGNVEVDATGLVAGKQYAFVPNEDGSPIGTFAEVTIPDQVQADAAQTDETSADYIKNLAPVAKSGSYDDLIDRPQLSTGIWKNVTDMFDIPTQADVKCWMDDSTPGKPLVRIHGTDTSGETNPLTITPAFGFGSNYERIADDAIVVRGLAGGVATDHLINVSAETADLQSEVNIPAACNYFDIAYFAGQGVRTKSYVYMTDGTARGFSADDTPISTLSAQGGSVTLRGNPINKNSIVKMHLGESYAGTTTLPDYFLSQYNALVDLDAKVLGNVTTIGSNVFTGLGASKVDLSMFGGVTSIGSQYLDNSKIEEADLSAYGILQSVGSQFYSNCPLLRTIKLGSVDFSSLTLGMYGLRNAGIQATGPKTIYADSQYIFDAFNAKFGGGNYFNTIGDFSVVIGPAPE